MNVGRRDNLDDAALVAFVSSQASGKSRMELHSSHAYLFVPEAQVDATIAAPSRASRWASNCGLRARSSVTTDDLPRRRRSSSTSS